MSNKYSNILNVLLAVALVILSVKITYLDSKTESDMDSRENAPKSHKKKHYDESRTKMRQKYAKNFIPKTKIYSFWIRVLAYIGVFLFHSYIILSRI